MKLHDCLFDTPHRELRIMTRLQQLETTVRPPKLELVSVIEQALLDKRHLRKLLSGLSQEEQAALEALQANGGRMDLSTFEHRFGQIKPFKPWRKDEDVHAWRKQNAAGQQLAYLGLIFRTPRRLKAGQVANVVLPEDLLPLLPALASPIEAAAVYSQPQPDNPLYGQLLLADVAALLSFIHREEVKALYKKRWFSPKKVAALNPRLQLRDDLTAVKSELQTTRIRFLHFLAESAGLMAVVGEHFSVTLAGWGWLKAEPEEQLAQLWQGWQANIEQQGQRWARFRYPKPPAIRLQDRESYTFGFTYDASPKTPSQEALKLATLLLKNLATSTAGQAINLHTFLDTLWIQEPEWWKFEVSNGFCGRQATNDKAVTISQSGTGNGEQETVKRLHKFTYKLKFSLFYDD